MAIINSESSEPFEKKINSIQEEIIKNPNNDIAIEKYINALSTRANYYKKAKRNFEKSSDDLRSALFFLSEDKNSDKYIEFSKRLGENLSDMEYYPTNSERLEYAKSLFWENKFFASAYEFEQLSAIGYEDYVCFEYLGDIYQKINRQEKAVEAYKKSIEKYSKNADVSYKLAKLYEKRNEIALANEKYRQTIANTKERKVLDEIINIYARKIQANPNNSELYEILAMAYKQENNYPKTYALLNKALSMNPNDITIKYELGNILYEMKEYLKAVKIYDSILAKNAYDTQIRIAKAKSLIGLGKKAEGVKEFQLVLALYPESLQAQYGIFKVFYGEPLDNTARRFYPLDTTFIPNSNLYEKLGKFAQEISQTEHATKFYKQALLKDDKNSNAYISLYDIYELENNKAEALLLIEEANKKLPDDKKILEIYESLNKDETTRKNEIALSYFKNNDFRKAIKIYEQINPKNSDVYLSIANCYTLLKNYKKAQENLENATKIDPTNSDIYYALALSYLNQNSPQSAKRELHKAIALNKNNLKAQKLLNSIVINEISVILENAGNLYYQKNYEGALEILNSALQKYGAHTQLFYYRGMINQAQNKYIEALEDYKKVTEIDNSYDPVYYSLGTLFEKIGKEKDALNAYERYLSGSPTDNESIKKAQEKVIELGKKYY